jgi:hypothetical protein
MSPIGPTPGNTSSGVMAGFSVGVGVCVGFGALQP